MDCSTPGFLHHLLELAQTHDPASPRRSGSGRGACAGQLSPLAWVRASVCVSVCVPACGSSALSGRSRAWRGGKGGASVVRRGGAEALRSTAPPWLLLGLGTGEGLVVSGSVMARRCPALDQSGLVLRQNKTPPSAFKNIITKSLLLYPGNAESGHFDVSSCQGSEVRRSWGMERMPASHRTW